MTEEQSHQLTEAADSIAGSLVRIADYLELLCASQSEVEEMPKCDRPAIYEALRHIAINVDRP